MNLFTMILPAALKLGMAYFEYKVTKTITEAEYKEIANKFAIARGKGNKSADAREDVEDQFTELEKEKLNEQSTKNI